MNHLKRAYNIANGIKVGPLQSTEIRGHLRKTGKYKNLHKLTADHFRDAARDANEQKNPLDIFHKTITRMTNEDHNMSIVEEFKSWLVEGEHWDKVRRNNDVEIQNAKQYAEQMLDQHGDDETVQKLCAVIMKLNPTSSEHQEQILDAMKQLEDYASEQIGHKTIKDKSKDVKESTNSDRIPNDVVNAMIRHPNKEYQKIGMMLKRPKQDPEHQAKARDLVKSGEVKVTRWDRR